MANGIVIAHDMSKVHEYMVDAMFRADDPELPPEQLIVMDMGDQAALAPSFAHAADALAHDTLSATTGLQQIIDAHVTDPQARAAATTHLANIGMTVPYITDGVKTHSAAVQTAYALMTKIKAQRDRLDDTINEIKTALGKVDDEHPLVAEFLDRIQDKMMTAILKATGTSGDMAYNLWRLVAQNDPQAYGDLQDETAAMQDMDEVQAAAAWKLALGVELSNRDVNALRAWGKAEAERRKPAAGERQL